MALIKPELSQDTATNFVIERQWTEGNVVYMEGKRIEVGGEEDE